MSTSNDKWIEALKTIRNQKMMRKKGKPTPAIAPLALAPKDAFAAIGVGITKGYELINAGELTAFKVGCATRITTDSLKAFVAKRVAEGKHTQPIVDEE